MSDFHPLVRLSYRRRPRKDTFDGYIEMPNDKLAFKDRSFESMMGMVSDILIEMPDCRLLMKRDEAPYPMSLPAGIEDLLRKDFVKAMAALTVPPRRVVVTPEKMVITTVLKSGIATLAEALGETVYVKLRNKSSLDQQIESPLTGRWVSSYQFPLPIASTDVSKSGMWATVRVEDLLATSNTRFYLPRGWNPSAGWIDRDSLKDMYDTYLREKQECIQAIVG